MTVQATRDLKIILKGETQVNEGHSICTAAVITSHVAGSASRF